MADPASTRFHHRKTAARGDRTFVGFDRRSVEALLDGFDQRVRVEPAPVQTHRDIRLLPLIRLDRGQFQGGVFDAGGFIEGLALRRGWRNGEKRHIDPGSARATAETVPIAEAFFGGYLFNHFGHFLLEGLARVIPGALGSDLPIVFLNPMGLKALPRYMVDVFTALGIAPERLILCNKPMTVELLTTIDPSYQIRGFVNASAAEAYKACPDSPRSDRAIYLSRTGLVGRRDILREAEFEAALERRFGVEVIHPETMSVNEQLRTLAAADTVIACAGSALHSLLLVGGTRKVVVVTPMLRDALNYLLCDELFGSSTIYVSGAKSFDEARVWEIDVECVLDTLDDCLSGS